jgi:hypothetical protein
MTDRSREADELLAVLQAFLDTPDSDSARLFADAHPELRSPDVVTFLVRAAAEARRKQDHDQACSLLAPAGLLCGSDWWSSFGAADLTPVQGRQRVRKRVSPGRTIGACARGFECR